MNVIKHYRRDLHHYRNINSLAEYQSRLFHYALGRYQNLMGAGNLGRVLTICSTPLDAEFCVQYPFSEIVITGLGDQRDEIMQATNGDGRVSYQQENAEALSFASQSFDLVFCKFGLHHLARPTLGLGEMLRCGRKAVIFLEPFDSLLRQVFERMGLTTVYERQQYNVGHRDNYVFAFSRRHLQLLLNSYYLDSGYQAELHCSWHSSRFNVRAPRTVRRLSALAGWAMQYLPGSPGNIVTAVILPGTNLPDDPVSLNQSMPVVARIQRK